MGAGADVEIPIQGGLRARDFKMLEGVQNQVANCCRATRPKYVKSEQ